MKKAPLFGRIVASQPRLSSFLGTDPTPVQQHKRPLIGVVEGCGIGPQIVSGALRVLGAIEEVFGMRFDLRYCGPVGESAQALMGNPLPDSALEFFESIFTNGGAILNGPAGGRFVYDLRKRFGLFCKFVPVRLANPLPSVLLNGNDLSQMDILFVRDNSGGVYQGEWETRETHAGRIAEHRFSYSEEQVRRIAAVAVRAATARRGTLHVVVKDGGVPAISNLWREVATDAAQGLVRVVPMNVDCAAYELIRNPAQFDVVLAPNLFGDILVDITGALVGSRGVTFSGNFDGARRAVYQTNHGCAHDLAGANVANPAGQILSLAMLLRESFGLEDAASLIERALSEAWRCGWRTADVAEPGCTVVGTDAMSEHVAEQVLQLAERTSSHEVRVAAD